MGNGRSINAWKDPWIPWIQGFIPTFKEEVNGALWNSVASLRLEDGSGWNLQLLNEICEPTMVAEIIRVDWTQELREDKLFWIGNEKGIFSVKNCYLAEIKSRIGVDVDPIWSRLWGSNLHERLKLHLWRMLANIIPSRQLVIPHT